MPNIGQDSALKWNFIHGLNELKQDHKGTQFRFAGHGGLGSPGSLPFLGLLAGLDIP
jgi:hypothetical protein